MNKWIVGAAVGGWACGMVGQAASAPLVLAQAAPAPASAAAAPAKPDGMDGHYAVLREKGRDTGCMITLEARDKGPKGHLKALLAPACRDQGIVIFDPVGWRVEKGRLALLARKGHETHLDMQADGTWLKDPKEGKPISLKRM